MKLSITAEDFESNKAALKKSIASHFGVVESLISIEIAVSQRRFRRVLNDVSVEVIVQTHDETDVVDTVNSESFESELSDRFQQDIPHLTISVSEKSQPVIMDIS